MPESFDNFDKLDLQRLDVPRSQKLGFPGAKPLIPFCTLGLNPLGWDPRCPKIAGMDLKLQRPRFNFAFAMRVFWLARAYVHPRHPGKHFGMQFARRVKMLSCYRSSQTQSLKDKTARDQPRRLGSKVQGLGTAWTFCKLLERRRRLLDLNVSSCIAGPHTALRTSSECFEAKRVQTSSSGRQSEVATEAAVQHRQHDDPQRHGHRRQHEHENQLQDPPSPPPAPARRPPHQHHHDHHQHHHHHRDEQPSHHGSGLA